MKLNQNGNVELYDFQVTNYISRAEYTIELLKKVDNSVVNTIANYIEIDLNMLKMACGIEIKEEANR